MFKIFSLYFSIDYTNWNSGEPNDWGSGEDCTEMYTNGKWNDMACSTIRRYVCEIGNNFKLFPSIFWNIFWH